MSLDSSTESADDLSTSSSGIWKHHLILSEPNRLKLYFPKQAFVIQKRSLSATLYQQPWFHYVQEEDSALCFYCATAVQRKMPMTRHTDKAFTETGFITGEKPCINSGNVSSLCHWYAVDTIRKNSKDVGEMLSTAHIKKLCICILFYLQYASLLTEDYLCMGVMSVTGVVNPIATLHSFYNRTKMMCLMAL